MNKIELKKFNEELNRIINEGDKKNIDFTVQTISSDGSDIISYNTDFYIENGVLYYLDEELSEDTTDMMDVASKILDYSHDTVLKITDDNDNIIYENEEFDDEDFNESTKKYRDVVADDKYTRLKDLFGTRGRKRTLHVKPTGQTKEFLSGVKKEYKDVKTGELFYLADGDDTMTDVFGEPYTHFEIADESLRRKKFNRNENDDLTHYVNQYGLTGTEQDSFYRKKEFPVKGNVYYTNIDFYFDSLDRAEDYLAKEDIETLKKNNFLKMFDDEEWIVFPKGTRMIYLGYTMGGDVFDIAGVELEVNYFSDSSFEEIDIEKAIS